MTTLPPQGPKPTEPEGADGPQPEAAVPPVSRAAARAEAARAEGEQDGSVRLDEGTFDTLVTTRSPARLEIEPGVWHQISPKYVWVQLIANGAVLVLIVAVMLVLALVLHQWWAFIPGGIGTIVFGWTLAITPRQARAIGYRLREDDLVFRRGILWQRIVAVPYGRMQLVDITHGPLDRGFGIAQLKFVTAAATTGVTIPGLPQATAEALRDQLIEVAESRRTGL